MQIQTDPLPDIPIDGQVQVDVVYFQGPSIKGVSGSPIISRENGKVVGIVSAKLSGIGQALEATREQIKAAQGSGGYVRIMGVNPLESTGLIINVLDDQLANGLGVAVGINDAAEEVEQAKKHPK